MEKYFFSAKPLDFLSINIIKQLYKYGPRNISFISRQLGYPKRTIYMKYTSLINKLNLKVKAELRYNMLGLVHTFIIYKPKKMKYYKEIIEKLKENPYFIEIWRYSSNIFSLLVRALIPVEAISYLYEYIDPYKLEEHARVYTTSSPYPILPDFSFYNNENHYWGYSTDFTVDENEKVFIPEDPKSFRIFVDNIDLEIINRILDDASIRISSIAKELKLSRPRIKYHFDNHIHPILLDRYIVDFQRFNEPTIKILVYLQYKNKRETLKAAKFYLKAPFIHFIYKEIKKYGLFLLLEIPRREFEEILYAYISKIYEISDPTNYFYLILNSKIYKKYIPIEFFSNKKWNINIFNQI